MFDLIQSCVQHQRGGLVSWDICIMPNTHLLSDNIIGIAVFTFIDSVTYLHVLLQNQVKYVNRNIMFIDNISHKKVVAEVNNNNPQMG